MDEGEPVIREAEAAKARLYETSGNNAGKFNAWGVSSSTGQVALSAAVDENFMVIGSHVDPAFKLKIINSEYVDFSKLIPKNKLNKDEDHRMELVSKGGYTYFLPMSDRESTAISGFGHWEQAFRVFSNIFTRAHPQKAAELIQYNHIIHYAANTFTWENVYTYDHEFHIAYQ